MWYATTLFGRKATPIKTFAEKAKGLQLVA
jgi:hypothetical protein